MRYRLRPVVLGLNNPHSADPKEALNVKPDGSTGARLWLMFKEAANREYQSVSEQDYLSGFDRMNLINGHFYNHDIAVARRPEMLKVLEARVVVMCGTGVLRALGLRHTGFHLEPQEASRMRFYTIPHPSGLCREYNDPTMRERVGKLLLDLYRRYPGE